MQLRSTAEWEKSMAMEAMKRFVKAVRKNFETKYSK